MFMPISKNIDWNAIKDKKQKAIAKSNLRENSKRKQIHYNPGDWILIKNPGIIRKLAVPYDGPYKVVLHIPFNIPLIISIINLCLYSTILYHHTTHFHHKILHCHYLTTHLLLVSVFCKPVIDSSVSLGTFAMIHTTVVTISSPSHSL